MSKKAPKGLSFDQKKEALLSAMLTEASIYNMKELENLGRKHRVIPQAVPEVVEALLAERTLTMDKIGTQNVYWAFPSQRKATLLNVQEKLKTDLDAARMRLTEAKNKSDKAKQLVRLSEKERAHIIQDTANFKKAVEALVKEKSQLEKKDPRVQQKKLEELKLAKENCNKFTDNICILRQYVLRKFAPVNAEALDAQFGITCDTLEYVAE
jgi:hypothetical protein